MSLPGIYIHVPYCISKCPYCDFYSHCGSSEEKDAYAQALIRDIESYRGRGICADTVYFGGGTPPMLGTDNLCRILEAVFGSFDVSDNSEITVEANPADELGDFFAQMKRSGVNRVSMGMQSGVESELKALGRRHDNASLERSVEAVRKAGIDNMSLDLMLAIPGQNAETLHRSIEHALSFSPEHLSAYLLIIEEGTPFYDHTPDIPNDDGAALLYEQAVGELENAGYRQYEISNFSRQGRESWHNLKYWHDEEYLGFGASAHSFFSGRRFFYPRDIDGYIAGKPAQDDGTGGSEDEFAMLALRLSEGITENRWQERFGSPISERYRTNAQILVKNGIALCDEQGIRLTKKGFLLSNMAISTIIE